MSSSGQMTCASCGMSKHHDGFPVTYYAQCWQCCWDRHADSAHPLSRAERRKIRRRARDVARSKLIAAARTEVQAGLLAAAQLKSDAAPVGSGGSGE